MSLYKADFSKPTCRVCLKNKTDEKMTSIFDMVSEWEGLQIYEKIECCASIKILCDKKLPNYICNHCNMLLNTSFEFRQLCQDSDELLKTYITTEEIQLKNETSEAIEENYLEMKENYEYTRIDSLSPLTEHLNDEPNLSCSPTDNEESITENFTDTGDVFVDIPYPDVKSSSSSNENIEVESVDIYIKPKIDLDKYPKRRKRKLKANKKVDFKLSSDDGAVIKQKRIRRNRKDKCPHVCEICGKVYHRRHLLDLHLIRHTDVKEFECEICPKRFYSENELKCHMRKHTGLRPYKCNYCPKAFGDHSTWTKHERVHRNERPYKCDICGSCFSYPNVLKRHKLVHTGEQPYKCEICGKCFNDRYHLQSHYKTIQHQDDPRVEFFIKNIRENNVLKQ